MPSPAETWNSRYDDPSFHAASRPNPFLLEALPFFPRGCALDLACGAGQNAVFLAERGWATAAIDVSLSALDRAESLATSRGLAARCAAASRIPADFPARDPAGKIELLLLRADLESFTLPAAVFDVILSFRYLQRSLFPAIERALRPGGVLVFETFTLDQLSFDRGPRNPDHLLQPGELRTAFPNLTALFYREWKTARASAVGALPCSAALQGSTSGEALASLLARKPSRR
jgi:tellurite methyltransferase